MTSPSAFAGPGSDAPRPGRKLGPIAERVGSAHRAWLEPVRDAYLRSGSTLSEVGREVPFAKSKLSELLRGTGLYPRWEVVCRLAHVLQVPAWPLYRLWRHAALEAQKSPGWIRRSEVLQSTVTMTDPPMDHRGLQRLHQENYTRYAQVFLTDQQADIAVRAAFDVLWLTWNQALASPDVNCFAWGALRRSVMARAPHRDGRPDLCQAVFDTLALQNELPPEHLAAQLEESLALFTHISGLPERQLDVIVVRHLCGLTLEKTSHLLGVSAATVRSTERHATRQLDTLMCPPPNEGDLR